MTTKGSPSGSEVPPPPRRRALRTTATLAFGVLLIALALSPEALRRGPSVCTLKNVTGIPCPGCGLTRSFVALLDGEPAAAFAFHPAGPLLVLVTLATGVAALVGLRRGFDPFAFLNRPSARALLIAAGITWIGWWVLKVRGLLGS